MPAPALLFSGGRAPSLGDSLGAGSPSAGPAAVGGGGYGYGGGYGGHDAGDELPFAMDLGDESPGDLNAFVEQVGACTSGGRLLWHAVGLTPCHALLPLSAAQIKAAPPLRMFRRDRADAARVPADLEASRTELAHLEAVRAGRRGCWGDHPVC